MIYTETFQSFEDFSDWYWRKVNLRRAEQENDSIYSMGAEPRRADAIPKSTVNDERLPVVAVSVRDKEPRRPPSAEMPTAPYPFSPHPLAATDGGLGEGSGAVRLLADKLGKECGELQAIIQAEIERINKL